MGLSQRRLWYFGVWAILERWLAGMFLVFASYNPSGFSFYHWFASSWPEDWTLLLPVAFVLNLAYLLAFRATLRALRLPGIALALGFLGTGVWTLLDMRVLSLATGEDLAIILLSVFGGLLAIGMSWIPLWTLLTGQVSIDNLSQ